SPTSSRNRKLNSSTLGSCPARKFSAIPLSCAGRPSVDDETGVPDIGGRPNMILAFWVLSPALPLPGKRRTREFRLALAGSGAACDFLGVMNKSAFARDQVAAVTAGFSDWPVARSFEVIHIDILRQAEVDQVVADCVCADEQVARELIVVEWRSTIVPLGGQPRTSLFLATARACGLAGSGGSDDGVIRPRWCSVVLIGVHRESLHGFRDDQRI